MTESKFSHGLLVHVSDGDLHTKMDGIDHSTNVREIVTVGYMVWEHYKLVSNEKENAAC